MAGRFQPRWDAETCAALIHACLDRQPKPLTVTEAVRRLHRGALGTVGVQPMPYTTGRHLVREERLRRDEGRLTDLAQGPIIPGLEQLARRMISAADDELARLQGHAQAGDKPLDLNAYTKLAAAVEKVAGIAARLPRDATPTATRPPEAQPTEPQLLDALRHANHATTTHHVTPADTSHNQPAVGVLPNVSESAGVGSGAGDGLAEELAAMRGNGAGSGVEPPS